MTLFDSQIMVYIYSTCVHRCKQQQSFMLEHLKCYTLCYNDVTGYFKEIWFNKFLFNVQAFSRSSFEVHGNLVLK